MVRVVNMEHRLPSEVIDAPCLLVFKRYLDTALNSMFNFSLALKWEFKRAVGLNLCRSSPS